MLFHYDKLFMNFQWQVGRDLQPIDGGRTLIRIRIQEVQKHSDPTDPDPKHEAK